MERIPEEEGGKGVQENGEMCLEKTSVKGNAERLADMQKEVKVQMDRQTQKFEKMMES